MTKAQSLSISAWGLGLFAVMAAIAVWLEAMPGRLRLDSYSLFPLFGLLAFSLMWTHYIVGALRRYHGQSKAVVRTYFKVTAVVVLLTILLHPGLLIVQLWRDGFGLPPNSYLENYVAPSGKFAVMLGSISLVIFLAFELKRKFGNRSWWRWVEYAQVVAMVAIFFHALKLGSELNVDWYRVLWLFYGISFILAVKYSYIYDRKKEGTK